ncbi:MAG: type III pantothenate kinase [Ignavibacteria bacterium]|nr:type III pantothenate kinase [Ignavibacteria bacterium]
MLLAIDIGNTHTVFGVYEKDRLITDWRVTSMLQRTEDEVGTQVQLFLKEAGIPPRKIDGVGISSVVPNLTDIFSAMAEKYFHVQPLLVSPALDLGFSIHYDDPNSVGADRLCNAVAGHARFGGPLIIIDFGTATTYDVVAANGDYLGGVISPGIETSAVDLHRRAAKLPKVELRFPKAVIGRDTVSSMQAGILLGAVDAMEGMVGRIQAEIVKQEGKKARVVATGGFARLMARHSTVISECVPSLVLDGVRLVYERTGTARRNRKKNRR